MRFRQLVIKGFKSFPDRTSLTFPPQGISAIVGPNGCGKSNILDAIRWVLGEQNPRILRARTMEDVIFSGPNGRQVGYAEVQMVLEVVAGQETRKVEVARRLYRTGEARYLIDGKAVRLKDILYLFMDTGSGTRAYALVDQGQVARFVEMGPGERKALVEEAAGISRYKQKRRETEARLRKSMQNMERMNDILAEIKREYLRTEKEAESAREYLDLKKRLVSYRKTLLSKLFTESMDKKRALIQEKNSSMGLFTTIERELKTKREKARKINSEIEENHGEYQDLLADENDLQKEKKAREQTIAKKRDMLERLRQQYREKLLRKDDMEARLQGLRKKKAGLEQDLQALLRKIDSLKAQYEREEEEYQRLSAVVGELRKTVSAIKDQIVDAKSNLLRVEGEEKGIAARINDYLRRREVIKKKLENLQEKETELTSRLASEHNRAEGLEEAICNLEHEADRLRDHLASLEEEEASRRSVFEKMNSRLRSTTHRLDAIREIVDKGLDLSDQTRLALELLERKGVAHGGLLVDQLRIEPGWDGIVEYILGKDFLQAILVDSNEDLQEALDVLTLEDARGPVWLVSCCLRKDIITVHQLDTTSSATEDTRSTSHGHGALSSTISCPACIHPYVMDRMTRFWSSGKGAETGETGTGASPSLVAGEGEGAPNIDSDREDSSPRRPDGTENIPRDQIIGQGCALFWGSDEARKEGSGLIQRRNQFKMLTTFRDQLLEQHSEAKVALQHIQSTISSLKARLKKTLDGLSTQKEGLFTIKSRISRTEHELSATREQSEALDLEARSILMDIEGLRKESQRLKGHKEMFTDRLSELETRLENELSTLNREESHIKEFQDKIARLKNDIVREETRGEELKRNTDSITATISRLHAQVETTQHMESRLKASLENCEKELRGLQQELDTWTVRLDDVRRAKEKIYERLILKRDEHSELLRAVERLEERKKEIVEKIHKKELLLSSLDQRISSIEEEAVEILSSDRISGLLPTETGCPESCGRPGKMPITVWNNWATLSQLGQVELKREIRGIRQAMDAMGAVNLGALDRLEELEERLTFLNAQMDDLKSSYEDLEKAISKIDTRCRMRFKETMDGINRQLGRVFPLLFNGGSARLELTEEGKDILDKGVEFLIRLPGKTVKSLQLLSGGEKALSALSLIFSIFFMKPAPFCVLDEVDAALDEANCLRFARLLQEIAQKCQVILITHNPRVMEAAHCLFGVTMEEKGISRLVSVKLK